MYGQGGLSKYTQNASRPYNDLSFLMLDSLTKSPGLCK